MLLTRFVHALRNSTNVFDEEPVVRWRMQTRNSSADLELIRDHRVPNTPPPIFGRSSWASLDQKIHDNTAHVIASFSVHPFNADGSFRDESARNVDHPRADFYFQLFVHCAIEYQHTYLVRRRFYTRSIQTSPPSCIRILCWPLRRRLEAWI